MKPYKHVTDWWLYVKITKVFTDRHGNIINNNSPDEENTHEPNTPDMYIHPAMSAARNSEITGLSIGVGNISNNKEWAK